MLKTPRALALLLVAVFALSACGGGDEQEPRQRTEACKDEITVQATTLPSGFDSRLQKGPGGGKDTPKDTIVYHWAGPQADTYIDVFRGGQRNKIEKGAMLDILGKNGRYKEITGGLGAKVKLGRGICTRYQFEAFKVSAEDFKKMLASLRRTPGASADE